METNLNCINLIYLIQHKAKVYGLNLYIFDNHIEAFLFSWFYLHPFYMEVSSFSVWVTKFDIEGSSWKLVVFVGIHLGKPCGTLGSSTVLFLLWYICPKKKTKCDIFESLMLEWAEGLLCVLLLFVYQFSSSHSCDLNLSRFQMGFHDQC